MVLEARKDESEKTAAGEITTPNVLRNGPATSWAAPPVKSTTTTPGKSKGAKDVPPAKAPSNKGYLEDLVDSLYNPSRGFRITKA